MDEDEMNPESVLKYPEQNKEQVLLNLLKNNIFLAAVADVITKNDFFRNKGKRSMSRKKDRMRFVKERDRQRN